jgi:hypothetical protein
MKKLVVSAAIFVGIFLTITFITNCPVEGRDDNRDRRQREDDTELEIQTGFSRPIFGVAARRDGDELYRASRLEKRSTA